MMSVCDLYLSGLGGSPALLPLTCRVPQPHDHEDFMRLCEPEERGRLRELGKVFWEMERAKNLGEGAAYAAGRRRHLGYGWEAKTLSNLHRVWVHGGYKAGDHKKHGPCFPARDFRSLMRAYKPGKGGLPAEFVEFLGQIFAEFRGRDDAVRAWYRHFTVTVWLANEPVPGYGRASEWYEKNGRVMPHGYLVRAGDLPDGWSESNLRLQLPKRKVVRAQLAHGYLAAHAHQPDMVLGDRSALRPFERVYLDDLRADLRCLWVDRGAGQIVYPLIVLALDASSGVDVANCAKPRATKEDGTRHGITRDMTLRVIIETLRRWGLPPWPITFVQENAAACVSRENRALLLDAFGERVQFEDTALFRERMSEHGFVESGGCPWHKAPLESFLRVLQTQLAALRGSTGNRYDQQHGELAAVEEYALAIVNAGKAVEELLAQLRTPLPRFETAHDFIERALRLLRFRGKHGLQGFRRVIEAQLPDGRWLNEAQLALLTEAEQEQAKIVSRLETPAERFTGGLQGVSFEAVDPDLLTWIEGPRFKVTVRAGKIETKDCMVANERLTFREPGNTLLEDACEGRSYEAAMAADASRLVLGAEGRLVGTVLRQGRVDVTDRDALHREMGRVKAARTADRVLNGYLLGPQDARDEALRAHNDTVLANAPAITAAAEAKRIDAQETTARMTATEQRANAKRSAVLAAAATAQLGTE